MKMVRTLSLILLALCVGGLIGCGVWMRSQTPTLMVISQTPIIQERVDAIRRAFAEYDITLADPQTLHLIPDSYRVMDSYYDALRIAEVAGAQPLAVYDTMLQANAFVTQLRALLLFICIAVDIVLGRFLWRWFKRSVWMVREGLEQNYLREFIRLKWKTLTLRALVLLGGLVVMFVLFSLCVFEPVWPPQSIGSFLFDIWRSAFPPVAHGSAQEKVRTAAAALLAAGCVITISGFMAGMIGWKKPF